MFRKTAPASLLPALMSTGKLHYFVSTGENTSTIFTKWYEARLISQDAYTIMICQQEVGAKVFENQQMTMFGFNNVLNHLEQMECNMEQLVITTRSYKGLFEREAMDKGAHYSQFTPIINDTRSLITRIFNQTWNALMEGTDRVQTNRVRTRHTVIPMDNPKGSLKYIYYSAERHPDLHSWTIIYNEDYSGNTQLSQRILMTPNLHESVMLNRLNIREAELSSLKEGTMHMTKRPLDHFSQYIPSMLGILTAPPGPPDRRVGQKAPRKGLKGHTPI